MNWEGIIAVASISFLKHMIAGVPASAVAELTVLESFIATFSGGVLGIIFFTFLIDGIVDLVSRFMPPRKKKKVFTTKKRLIARVRMSFGLTGIAALTPLFFSSPLGAFIALRFYDDKWKIIRYMIVSFAVWSLIGAFLSEYIKQLIDWINGLL